MARRKATIASGVFSSSCASKASRWAPSRLGTGWGFPCGVLVAGGLLAAAGRAAVLDDAGGVGQPFRQDALPGLEVQLQRRALQRQTRVSSPRNPQPKMSFLRSQSGQRLMRRQIEHAGQVFAARGEQALAGQPGLRRLDGPQRAPARAGGAPAGRRPAGTAPRRRPGRRPPAWRRTRRHRPRPRRARGGRPCCSGRSPSPAAPSAPRRPRRRSRACARRPPAGAAAPTASAGCRTPPGGCAPARVRLRTRALSSFSLALSLSCLSRPFFSASSSCQIQRPRRPARQEHLLGIDAVVGQIQEGLAVGVRLADRRSGVGAAIGIRLAEDEWHPAVAEVDVQQAAGPCLGDRHHPGGALVHRQRVALAGRAQLGPDRRALRWWRGLPGRLLLGLVVPPAGTQRDRQHHRGHP